jgi:hypothetical protein
MGNSIRKTISLPPDLAREALSLSRRVCLKQEFGRAQDFWSMKARERGVLTEKDLERHLRLPPGVKR